MHSHVRFACAFAVLCAIGWAAGCQSGPEVQIYVSEGFGEMPAGECAVLEVTARPLGRPQSYGFFWGVLRFAGGQEAMAEIIALAAREEIGLAMLETGKVREALAVAEVKQTYEPTRKTLDGYVRTLGCKSYLSAHVAQWKYRYVLFSGKASVDVVVACHVPGREEPLWWVRAEMVSREMDERQTALAALRAAFRKLKAADAAADAGAEGP